MSPGAKPKFNFIPERQLLEGQAGNGCWYVTASITQTSIKGKPYHNYYLFFPKEMVSSLDLDGKYFTFFADIEKKSIGWKVIEGGTELDTLAGAKKTKANNGTLKFGVKSLFTAMGYVLARGNPLRLRVDNYKSLLQGDISYVILPPVEKPQEAQATNTQ